MPRSALNLALLLATTLLISACSKQSIYDSAIGWERSSAGLETAEVSIGELDIAYLRSKEAVEGDTLVLIHGFGANKDNWTRLAKEFKGEFNVYAIDLPGHGDSSKPLDIGYRFEDQVNYLNQVLAELGVKQFHMMGNSMGGAITALYAATHPEQIQTAVLFDPAGIFEYESELVDRVLDGDNPLIPKKEGDFDRLLDFALEKRPFVPWPIFDVMEEKAIANREVNEVIFAAIRDTGFEPDFRDAITRIEAPVLVVWGKLDRVIDYRNADVFVEAIPNARKVLLDDVGHAPMVEVPKESAQLFREFLAN
ncbi:MULTISPECIES: alpha/beta fold hydrolase [unclassified Marinobacter]|uniref:Lipase n=1 Tax=Marinobacter nauticus TaxID=2743 RepID=A0A455WHC7_MARNT|nr:MULTISPECIES: alpha/beta hydrolase [unclassified Marinobacter]QFS88538.1 Lipase 3 precursor [Marinobacter sp. THAF197a]QFT52323.1 Lipase 3 precursor [Marinobacter sp. THAF39]BBJ05633.1 lipase [Marinobacter nauticus]